MNDLINFISTITKKERLSSVADTNIRFWLTTIVCLQIFRKLKLTNNVEKSWKFLKYNFQKIFCVSRPVQSMQNVYPVFVAHPVYTASQVMKILLAAERVKYLTKSFSLENSLAASRSIRFSVDRRCTLLSPSLSPVFPHRTCFNVRNRSQPSKFSGIRRILELIRAKIKPR